jgi:tyrosyl-tRNA synthetase
MHVLDELEARGFIKQCSDLEGLRALMNEGPVTYYVGFDPTASSLHVGNLVSILVMTHLQRAGHRCVAVVGGGTGMVGDPSGKTEARQMLTAEVIQSNLLAQKGQLSRFLELDDPERGLVVNNADWLLGIEYISFLRDIGSCFSVNRMLAAESYKQRLEKGLSFLEFNYQLLQAYDFLVLNQREGCRLQMGGDDQWGNILAGIDLIRRKEQVTAYALTTPLLTTADGKKMGKTHSGAVWLDAERFAPFDFFQYWLNVDDRDVGRFLRIFTFLPLARIEELEALTGADIRTAKRVLAREITTLLHGAEAAQTAEAAGKAMAAGRAAADLPTHAIAETSLVVAVLADAGLTKSRGEARRMVQQGGVRIDNDKLHDVEATLDPASLPDDGVVLRVGKKRAVRVTR